jgi:hypothetical protein
MKPCNRLTARRAFLIALGTLPLAASAMPFDSANILRPVASEFGHGPRASAKRLYVVTLKPSEPLRPRKLYTLPLVIADKAGRPVEGAVFSIDGGMPEHKHGLPTRPRSGRVLGAGVYEIEGLRFNMGGWWELKLTIQSPAGADHITFNLDL